MVITMNIYYTGENGSAFKFVEEMIESGTVDTIRNEDGNIRYDYYFPLDKKETVLLIDTWKDQEALDLHHKSEMMNRVFELREKYNLHIDVERYLSDDNLSDIDICKKLNIL